MIFFEELQPKHRLADYFNFLSYRPQYSHVNKSQWLLVAWAPPFLVSPSLGGTSFFLPDKEDQGRLRPWLFVHFGHVFEFFFFKMIPFFSSWTKLRVCPCSPRLLLPRCSLQLFVSPRLMLQAGFSDCFISLICASHFFSTFWFVVVIVLQFEIPTLSAARLIQVQSKSRA